MQKFGEKLAFLCHGAVFSLFFVLIEGMKAYRSSQWSGTTAYDLAGVATGFFLYWAVLVVVSGAGMVLFRSVRRAEAVDKDYSLPALGLASVILWALLSRYREFTPTLEDAIVIAGIAGLVIAGGAARRFFDMDAASFAGIAVTALLCAWVTLYAAGHYWLFDPDRADRVTMLPLAAGAVAFVLAALPCILPFTRSAGLRAGVRVLLLAAPWLLYLGFTHTPHRSESVTQPNFVLVISDTLRAQSMGLHGGPVPTPHLNAMAESGHVFDRAYALAPWTLPSMTAMFASDYPPSLTPGASGDTWTRQLWYYAVPSGRKALAEKLQEAGYATGAFTSNAFLPVIPGLMAGFDTYASAHPILLLPQGFFNHLPFLQDLLLVWAPSVANLRPHNTTIDMTHYAEAFLKRHRNQPFYLWVHYIDPHAPYDPPAAYRTLSGAWPFFHPYTGGERWGIPILGPDYTVPEADRDYVASLYDGEVAYMDAFLGRLRRAIVANGLEENTYICFTSDHGEELWEHGDWGHGQSLYEEQVHVPLLFAGPGIPPGRTAAPVSALDLMPTFADLLASPPEAAWKGISLRPVLEGKREHTAGPIFLQGTSNKAWPHPLQAVIDDGYKLIRALDTGALSLFNLAEDPGETRNLAEEDTARAASMAAMLDAWMETFPSVFPDEDGEDGGANAELFDELRGMGYLQ